MHRGVVDIEIDLDLPTQGMLFYQQLSYLAELECLVYLVRQMRRELFDAPGWTVSSKQGPRVRLSFLGRTV